jgi:hypothetical protein
MSVPPALVCSRRFPVVWQPMLAPGVVLFMVMRKCGLTGAALPPHVHPPCEHMDAQHCLRRVAVL